MGLNITITAGLRLLLQCLLRESVSTICRLRLDPVVSPKSPLHPLLNILQQLPRDSNIGNKGGLSVPPMEA